MNYSNQNYKNNVSHRRRKRRRPHYVRIISLLLFLFLLGYGGKYAWDRFTSQSNSTALTEEPKVYRLLSKQELLVMSPVSRPTIHLKKSLDWKYSIVPGSNHIGAASEYAYDTREIRDYIRGKKEYTGKDKLVFLTFDDGPNQKISPLILDTLKQEGVHGTFFVVGRGVHEKNSSVLKREINEGHSIAIHSFTHDYKILYPGRKANPSKVMEEYHRTNQAIKDILGEEFDSKVFRYPGGHMSWKNIEAADAELEKENIVWLDWNSLCGDGEPKRIRPTTAQGMFDFTVRTANSNVNKDVIVVLMHDAENKSLTAQALPQIIKHFKNEGYKFGILK